MFALLIPGFRLSPGIPASRHPSGYAHVEFTSPRPGDTGEEGRRDKKFKQTQNCADCELFGHCRHIHADTRQLGGGVTLVITIHSDQDQGSLGAEGTGTKMFA